MKRGARAVGIAESYGPRSPTAPDRRRDRAESTVAAAVVRGDRAVDGLAFGSWTVGGTDATAGLIQVVEALGREDVQYLLVSGIAPAWFNVLDLAAIESTTGFPVLSVSFESSPGLEPALEREFEGEALEVRLGTYRRQPERRRVAVDGEVLFVRSVGVDDDEARDVVRAYTPEGGRPEPLRVARMAARAAEEWRGSG